MTNLLTTLTRQSAGDPLPWIETLDHTQVITAGITVGTNVCNYYRVRPRKSRRTTTVKFRPQTQSGNVDVGVCSYSGTTMTKLASSGSTAVGASTVVQSIALTFDWVAGQDYWITIACDNTATFNGLNSLSGTVSAVDNMAFFKATAFPIADQTSVTAGTNAIAWLRFE